MGIVVDLIIVLIVGLATFIGYKRGLIKCAINILSFIIAIIVVILLTKPISNLIIQNTQIDDNMKATISRNLNLENKTKEEIKLNDENSKSPEVVKDYVNNKIENIASDATKDLADTLAGNIAEIVINIAVAILLFVLTKVALAFVKVLADVLGKIPLIKQFNNAGGLIYGIFSGIVVVYLILALISVIIPLLANQGIAEAINASFIGKGMYNNNLLLKIIL